MQVDEMRFGFEYNDEEGLSASLPVVSDPTLKGAYRLWLKIKPMEEEMVFVLWLLDSAVEE